MALTSPVIVDLKTLNSSNELELNMSHYRDFSVLVIPDRPIYIDKITVEVLSPTGYTVLQENIDYLPILPFRAAIRSEGKAIYGALLIHEGYSGVTLRLTYIPIEEDYSVSSSTVYAYIEHRTDRIYEMSYDEIIEGSVDYPLRESYQDYTTYLEKDALENELDLIAQAISLDNGTLTKLTNYINNTPIIAGQANTQINYKVLKTGSIMQGPIEVQSTPSDPNDAVTYGYLNTIQTQKQNNIANLASDINNLVNRDGDTLQGPLHLARDPEENNELATKNYVLSKVSTIAPEELPTGAVVLARKNWNQPGYLKCNGVELNKADYPLLYLRIQDTFSKKYDPGYGEPERNQYEFNDYEPNFDKITHVVDLNLITQDGDYYLTYDYATFRVLKNKIYSDNNSGYIFNISEINSNNYTNYYYNQIHELELDISPNGKIESYTVKDGSYFNNTNWYDKSFKVKDRIYYVITGFIDSNDNEYYEYNNAKLAYRTIQSDGTLSDFVMYMDLPLTFRRSIFIVTISYVYMLGFVISEINDTSNPSINYYNSPFSYRFKINEDASLGAPELIKNNRNIYFNFLSYFIVKNNIYLPYAKYYQSGYLADIPAIYQAKILPNGEITSIKHYKNHTTLINAYKECCFTTSKFSYLIYINYTDNVLYILRSSILPDGNLSDYQVIKSIAHEDLPVPERFNNFINYYNNSVEYYLTVSDCFATSSKLYIYLTWEIYNLPSYYGWFESNMLIGFDLLGGFNDYLTYELPHVYYYTYINETPWNNQTLIDNTTIPDSNFSTVNEVIDLYDGNSDNAFVFATKNKVYIYGLYKYDYDISTTIYSNYVGDINTDGSLSALTPITLNIDTSTMINPYSFIYNNEAYLYAGFTDINTFTTTYKLYKAPIDNNGVIGNFTSISSYAYSPNNMLTPKFSFVYNDSLFTLINMGSLDSFGFRRIKFKNGSENIPYGPFSFINSNEVLVHLIHKDQWVYLITENSSDEVYRIYRFVLNSDVYDWSSVTLMSTLNRTTSTVVDFFNIQYASTYITDNAIYFIGVQDYTSHLAPSKILKLPIDSSGVVDLANLVQIGSLPSMNLIPKLVATSTRLYIFPGKNYDHANYGGLYNKYYYIEANVGLTNYIVNEVQGPIVPNIKVPEQPDPSKFNIPDLPDENGLSYYIKT